MGLMLLWSWELTKLLISLTYENHVTHCIIISKKQGHMSSQLLCHTRGRWYPKLPVEWCIATKVCRITLRQAALEHCIICLTLPFVLFRDVDRKIDLWLSLIPMWPFIASAASPVCLRGPNTTCYCALSDSSAVLNPGENPSQSALPFRTGITSPERGGHAYLKTVIYF